MINAQQIANPDMWQILNGDRVFIGAFKYRVTVGFVKRYYNWVANLPNIAIMIEVNSEFERPATRNPQPILIESG